MAEAQVAARRAGRRVAAADVLVGLLGQPDEDQPPLQLVAVAPAQDGVRRGRRVRPRAAGIREMRDLDRHSTSALYPSEHSTIPNSLRGHGPPRLPLRARGRSLVPTGLTRGPWDRRFQHAGPPAALLARAIERAAAVAPGQIGRLAYDILRPVPLAPHRVTTRTLRPGRNVEQIEATLTDAESGDELMRLNAWRLRTEPLELPGGLGEPDPPPAPPRPAGSRCRSSGPSRSPTTPRSTGASSPATSTRPAPRRAGRDCACRSSAARRPRRSSACW